MSPRIVSIGGTVFDTDAAFTLLGRLREEAPRGPILLDFSHARDVHDCALAAVAEALAREGLDARYQGLLHHQERMLLYLGFGAST